MTERWIGLDIGTTHIKAVAIDDKAVLATRTIPTPAHADGDGVSRDARAVVDATKRVLKGVVHADRARPVAGISVASVGEEVVLVDGHGSPVGPVLSWFDLRGHREARDFAPTSLHDHFPPDPSWSLFKLLWLRRNRPNEIAAAKTILDLASFILFALGAPALMDWSHASRTGLFDPVAVGWDPETLDRADLRLDGWPELIPSGSVVGRIDRDLADELGITPSAQLVSGGHDHFVGAFGSGIRASGDCHLSAGTSEAFLVLSAAPIDAPPGIDQGRFVDAAHWYLHAAAPGGHVYGQWRELLYHGLDEALVRAEVAARDAPVASVVEIDPVTHSASLRDVPMTAERSQVMRAVVEGAAMSSATVFTRLGAAVPTGITRIVVAGHAADDPLWRSLRLGLIGRSMEVVREREVTAIGAALLARTGVTGDSQPFTATDQFAPTLGDAELAARLRERYEAIRKGGANA